MMTIWKYPVSAMGSDLEMPRGAKVLCVQTQDGTPCLWAIVDTEKPKEVRRFVMAGTGHNLPDDIMNWTYVGTFQVNAGLFVFHLFEA